MGWADGDGNRGGPGGVGMGGRGGGRGGDRGGGRGGDRGGGGNDRDPNREDARAARSRASTSELGRSRANQRGDGGKPTVSEIDLSDARKGKESLLARALASGAKTIGNILGGIAGGAVGGPLGAAIGWGLADENDIGGKGLKGMMSAFGGDRAPSDPDGGRDPVGGGGGEGGGYLPRLPAVSLPVVAAPPPAAPEPVSPFAQFDEEAERLRLKFEADAARNRLPFQFGRPLSPLDFTV